MADNTVATVEGKEPFKTRRKPSGSRAKYQKERGEKGRAERGNRYMESEKEKARERLGYGLSNESDLLTHAGDNTTRKSIGVAVTTRGIGITTCETYRTLASYVDARPPSIFATYRVGLFCLEAKVHSIRGKVVPLGRIQADNEEERSYGASFFQNAQTVSGLPRPVEMVVNAIGIVKTSGATYFPVLPAQVYNTHNGVRRLCPLPERVSFSSLGKIVRALADQSTPIAWRRHFFEHNPLPGAKITNNLLMNPTDFIVDGYDEDQLLDDIREFSRLNSLCLASL